MTGRERKNERAGGVAVASGGHGEEDNRSRIMAAAYSRLGSSCMTDSAGKRSREPNPPRRETVPRVKPRRGDETPAGVAGGSARVKARNRESAIDSTRRLYRAEQQHRIGDIGLTSVIRREGFDSVRKVSRWVSRARAIYPPSTTNISPTLQRVIT